MLSDLTIFTGKIFEIARRRFKKDNLSYPGITIFNLYFIDFLLWKLYDKEVKNNTISKPYDDQYPNDIINLLKWKISNKKDTFNYFKFKRLDSKEHLFPQASIQPITDDYLNSIGNICLITTSENSEGNKENPSDKKERFENRKPVTSLKRLIMFESFNENNEWKIEQIKKHEEEINALINLYI
jgi:hypothetical protein